MKRKSFGSDNHSGMHPQVIEALIKANTGHCVAYGDDDWTRRTQELFAKTFGPCEVFFVFNGTGANTLSIKAATNTFNAVICAETAHINVDECGAPENFTGCKLKTVKTVNGKLTPELLEPLFHGRGDQHHVQPKIISITQSTELGTLYKPDEIKALAQFAHSRGLYLHIDGARLSNAATALNCTFKEITADCGTDIVSFGGTKNGLMLGESIVVFNKELARDMLFIRKQGMQLASKMRFVAAQFEALLSGDLWRHNALHANRMAALLAQSVRGLTGVEIVYPTEVNAVFARIPKAAIEPLQQEYFFYVWDEDTSVVRWMCSFDTTEEDVHAFADAVKKIISARKSC